MNQTRKVSWLAAAAAAGVLAAAGQAAATGAAGPCGPLGDVFISAYGFKNPGQHDVSWTLTGDGVNASGSARVEFAAVIPTGVQADRPLVGTFSWWGSKGLETVSFPVSVCPQPVVDFPPVYVPVTPTAPDPGAKSTTDPVPSPGPVPVPREPQVTTPAKPVPPPAKRRAGVCMRLKAAKRVSPAALLRNGCVRLPRCPRGRVGIITAAGRGKCVVRASSTLREAPAG